MHVCVFIYVQNNYTQCTHTYYVNKNLKNIHLLENQNCDDSET